jgi:uncharacterized damage-inducible protein DinB
MAQTMTESSSVLKRFYRFNRNVRLHYLQTLAKIPEGELLKDRGASYPSLLDIFVHVLEAYDFWFLHVIPSKMDTYSDSVGKIKTLEEVRKFEEEIGSKVNSYIETLTETDLARMIQLPFDSETSSLSDICWHMVEEELQHRGELNALLWQMNIDPPVGSYRDWEDAKEAKKSSQ